MSFGKGYIQGWARFWKRPAVCFGKMHHPLEKGFIDWESMQELKKKGCFIKAAN